MRCTTMKKPEIVKLRNEYFHICDRIYLNEISQKEKNSKLVEEQLEKDKARRDELEKLLDS